MFVSKCPGGCQIVLAHLKVITDEVPAYAEAYLREGSRYQIGRIFGNMPYIERSSRCCRLYIQSGGSETLLIKQFIHVAGP